MVCLDPIGSLDCCAPYPRRRLSGFTGTHAARRACLGLLHAWRGTIWTRWRRRRPSATSIPSAGASLPPKWRSRCLAGGFAVAGIGPFLCLEGGTSEGFGCVFAVGRKTNEISYHFFFFYFIAETQSEHFIKMYFIFLLK